MLRNDLHVHTSQSGCGLHSLWEVVKIGASKGLRLINISDHGPGVGRHINFGVLVDRLRLPDPVTTLDGYSLKLLRGIEANFISFDGKVDVPVRHISHFDLISIGFHGAGDFRQQVSEVQTTKALERAASNLSFDLLTHPCRKSFKLDIPTVVDLAVEYGFALEINNTGLRLGKTDRKRLSQMIDLALQKKALLYDASDGHSYGEIGENEQCQIFLQNMGVSAGSLLNRDDQRLDDFVQTRKSKRALAQDQPGD